MLGRRADAHLVPNLSNLRRMMPYISPRRNESLFYMMQDIEVEAALEYLDKKNVERPPERPLTLFHLLLRAVSHAIEIRPGVNRFVKGGRLWQRDGEWLTFSAKRAIQDGSPMFTVKRRFEPTRVGLEEMVDAIYDRLESGRAGRKTTSDKETALLLRFPGFVVRAALALTRLADGLGLLPRRMIEADPLFSSVFLANLGSIDYPAGHHHLWEWGTCSIFGVMGRIEQGAEGRRKITMAWTYDERIEDGLYSYHSLEIIRKLVESPELLERTTGELVEQGWERR
jgi:hypothetical protein